MSLTQPHQHRELILILDLHHILPDSLDIYVISCCGHGCVCKSFTHEIRTRIPLGLAVLVSFNPTNLVLVGAFSISFTTFTAFMAPPFLATAIATYPAFLAMFHGRDYIPRLR